MPFGKRGFNVNKYVKCPRCELNFIIEGKQEYCDVCIAEMKGSRLQFADLEDEELEAELESEAMELCPVCGVNNMRYGETMCEACKKQAEYDEEAEDEEQDEEWKNYLSDESEDLSLDEEELAEELAEVEEEEEEYAEEEDDFFEEDVDALDDLDDDDDFDDDDDDDDDLF